MTPLYVIELDDGRLLEPTNWAATLLVVRFVARRRLGVKPIRVARVHRHFEPGDRVRHLHGRADRPGIVVSGLELVVELGELAGLGLFCRSYTVKWDDGDSPFPYPSTVLLPAS